MLKKKITQLPSVEEIRRVFSCDNDGTIRWNISPKAGRKRGDVAGGFMGKGKYRFVTYRRNLIAVHVIVFAFCNGRWPAHDVDHIDRDTKNNHPLNLREATYSQNIANQRLHKNNTTGVRGVCLYRPERQKCWRARIMVNGMRRLLGYFETKDGATTAYNRAAKEAWGQHYTIQSS